jgi:hypothetical protein
MQQASTTNLIYGTNNAESAIQMADDTMGSSYPHGLSEEGLERRARGRGNDIERFLQLKR